MKFEPKARGVHPTASIDDLTPGDLVEFWDRTGIFLGLMGPDDVEDVNVMVIARADDGVDIMVTFRPKGKPDADALTSTLTFDRPLVMTDDVTQQEVFCSKNVVFMRLLMEGEVRILPRIQHPAFSYQDYLRLVHRVSGGV